MFYLTLILNFGGTHRSINAPKIQVHSEADTALSRPQFPSLTISECRSQWPRDLRRRSTVACLLRSWVRIPLGAWMFVCCECCVLSGRGPCDGLITRPGESYRLWRVVVCDQETSYARRLKPDRGLQNTNTQWVVAPVEKKTISVCDLFVMELYF